MTIASVLDALGDRGADGMHTIPASATVSEAVQKMGELEIGALTDRAWQRFAATSDLARGRKG